jgi:O-antigen ligase
MSVSAPGILTGLRRYVRDEGRWILLLLGLIGGYVLIIPSVSFIPTLDPYNEKRVLQIGLLLTVGVVLLAFKEPRRAWLTTFGRLPRFARGGLAVVLGLGLLSSALAPAPFYAVLEVAHVVLLFVAAGAVASVVRRGQDQLQWVLLGTVVLSGLLYAVYFAASYAAFVVIPGLDVGRETVSGFANIRHFNQYQTWSLPLLIGGVLAVPSRRAGVRGLVLGLAALWWTLVFASGVRATMLAVAGASLIAWAVFRSRAHRWMGVQLLAVLLGGVIYFFAFYLVGEQAPQVVDRLNQEGGYSWRLQRWRTCLELVTTHPWLGGGPMHFAWPPFHFEPGAHPHNAFLQWLAEWGVPSTVLMSGMIIWGGWQWMQQENEEASTASPRSNAVRVALVASLLAGTAHAMVSGLLVMPVSQILLVLVGGWAWGRFQYRSTTPETSVSVGAQAAFCVLLIASIGIVGSSLQALKTIKERRSAFLEAVERNKLSPRYWAQGYIGVQDSTVLKRARRDR